MPLDWCRLPFFTVLLFVVVVVVAGDVSRILFPFQKKKEGGKRKGDGRGGLMHKHTGCCFLPNCCSQKKEFETETENRRTLFLK